MTRSRVIGLTLLVASAVWAFVTAASHFAGADWGYIRSNGLLTLFGVLSLGGGLGVALSTLIESRRRRRASEHERQQLQSAPAASPQLSHAD